MTINGVPWAIGGGAIVDEGVARMIPYQMFAGTEGVINSTDCEVKAQAVPNGTVRVTPGGYNILGRAPGQLYESYMNRITADETVSVDATTGATRSDLVVLRILDSHVPGSPWSDPVSLENGPYADVFVIKGVPSTTRNVRQLGNNWSAITLARIDIPINTGTITQAMIVPLRNKCGPIPPPIPPPTYPKPVDEDGPDNPEAIFFNVNPGPSSGSQQLTSSSQNNWRVWPAIAEWTISIPKWATHMDILCVLWNSEVDEDVWGETRIEIGNAELYTPANMYDFNYHGGPGPERFMVATCASTLAIPSGCKNKNKRFRMNARSLGVPSSHTGTLHVNRGTFVSMQVYFKEQCS